MASCSCNIPDFLVDPISGDSFLNTNPRNLSIDFAVMAPWVKIAVNGSPDDPNAQIITVGNQSQGNLTANAAIKSFQYGFSNGFTVTFEIVDIEGGNFCNFINKLIKNLDDNFNSIANTIQFKWGWGGGSCITESQTDFAKITSNIHTAFITHIVPTLENGMFKFALNCVDLSDVFQQQIADKEFGEVSLVEAIANLFFFYAKPPVTDITYQLRDGTGNIISMPDQPDRPFFSSDNGATDQMLGPVSKWSSKSRNPLSVLQDWLGVVTSINGKGFKFALECGANGNNLIIKEDDKPSCSSTAPIIPASQRRVYVVNGGNPSKVLSFRPHIRWTYLQSLKAGGIQPINQNADIPQDDLEDCQDLSTEQGEAKPGISTSQSPEHPVDENRGADAAKLRIEADRQQFLAESVFEAITAELKIQGDPTYEYYTSIGEFITIVVINAFVPSASANSCDWTIQTVGGSLSACNSILSNKNWMIRGVSHDIVEGSYTTTLDLILAAPGVDISVLLGIGG